MKRFFLVAFLLVGCSQQQKVCESGSTQKCVCVDGRSGAQSCSVDGSGWASCRCTASVVDGGAEAISEGSAEKETARTCYDDKDCEYNEHCIRGVCVLPTGGSRPVGGDCTKDGDCQAGLYCNDSQVCTKPECTTNSECQAKQKCRELLCVPGCEEHIDCKDFQICKDDICVDQKVGVQPLYQPCHIDDHCQAGLYCFQFKCVPKTP